MNNNRYIYELPPRALIDSFKQKIERLEQENKGLREELEKALKAPRPGEAPSEPRPPTYHGLSLDDLAKGASYHPGDDA